eukprot:173767_1
MSMEEKKLDEPKKRNSLTTVTCYPIDVDEDIKMGYIEKRSKWVHKWRYRYMVLNMKQCTLSTYKDSDMKEMTANIVLGEKTEVISIPMKRRTKEKIDTNISDNNESKKDYNDEGNANIDEPNMQNTVSSETIDTETYGFELHFNNKKSTDTSFKVNKNGEIYINPNAAAQNTMIINYPDIKELNNIRLPIRCKFERSRDEWIDLIKDCIIRSKYHKYFLMDIIYVNDENIEEKQEDIDTIPVIKTGQYPVQMVAMLRELLELRHNNGKWKYWQILGHIYGKYFANIKQCVMCYEKAMEWRNKDINILKDFVMILQKDNIKELNSLYVADKKRQLYQEMIEINGYNVLNMDYDTSFCDDFCNTLVVLKDYNTLSNVLGKIAELNLNMRKDMQAYFWLELSNKIGINADAMENVILNLKPNKLNMDLELKMYRNLIVSNPIKQYKYLKKMEEIYMERENYCEEYGNWNVNDLNQFAWILMRLGETIKAKKYLEIAIGKDKNNIETLKLIDQNVIQQQQKSMQNDNVAYANYQPGQQVLSENNEGMYTNM